MSNTSKNKNSSNNSYNNNSDNTSNSKQSSWQRLLICTGSSTSLSSFLTWFDIMNLRASQLGEMSSAASSGMSVLKQAVVVGFRV